MWILVPCYITVNLKDSCDVWVSISNDSCDHSVSMLWGSSGITMWLKYFCGSWENKRSEIMKTMSIESNYFTYMHTWSLSSTFWERGGKKTKTQYKNQEVSTGRKVQPLFLKTEWENPIFESFRNKCWRPDTKCRGNTFSVSGRLVILYMSVAIAYSQILTLIFKVHFLLICDKLLGRVTLKKNNYYLFSGLHLQSAIPVPSWWYRFKF